jgi:AcrR family transcriptional regulator
MFSGMIGAVTAPRRWETRKRETRRTLLAVARAMFAERGFEPTTVHDIADAAGVTERTFYRYFASKDDLVYSELLDLLPELHRAIVEAPAGLPPLLAFRDAVLDLARAQGPGASVLFGGQTLLRPNRTAAVHGLLLAVEAKIADAMQDRVGRASTRLQAEVLARTAIAALRSCLIHHAAADPAGVPLTDLLIEAFDVFNPSPAAPTTVAQGQTCASSCEHGRAD